MIDVRHWPSNLEPRAAAVHPEGVVAADGAGGADRPVAAHRRRLARRGGLDVPLFGDAEPGSESHRLASGDRGGLLLGQREAVAELGGALERASGFAVS